MFLCKYDEILMIGVGVQFLDGVWQIDENGQQYFFDKYLKIEGVYCWVDEEKGIVWL